MCFWFHMCKFMQLLDSLDEAYFVYVIAAMIFIRKSFHNYNPIKLLPCHDNISGLFFSFVFL